MSPAALHMVGAQCVFHRQTECSQPGTLFLPWLCGFWVTFIFPLSADICEFSPAWDCFIIRRKVILKKQKLHPNIPAARAADAFCPCVRPQGWLHPGGGEGQSDSRLLHPWGWSQGHPSSAHLHQRWGRTFPALHPILSSPWEKSTSSAGTSPVFSTPGICL